MGTVPGCVPWISLAGCKPQAPHWLLVPVVLLVCQEFTWRLVTLSLWVCCSVLVCGAHHNDNEKDIYGHQAHYWGCSNSWWQYTFGRKKKSSASSPFTFLGSSPGCTCPELVGENSLSPVFVWSLRFPSRLAALCHLHPDDFQPGQQVPTGSELPRC